MSDSITTKVDTTGPVSDDTRAAAARVIRAMAPDADDLLAMLGLTGETDKPAARGVSLGGTRQRCPVCGLRTRANGVCRRNTGCENRR